MKKAFLSFMLLAGLAGTAQAQSDISLGLKAGGTLSSFVGKQAGSAKSIFGFQAGGFANIGFTDMLAFQPELLYSQKGAEIPSVPNPHDTHLGYVDVPLMLHVNANGLFFEAGPQLGFLVSAKDKYNTVTYDRKSRYNTFDLGYAAGLGYQRKTGPGIGLRYNGGITNIEKATTVGSATVQRNIRNSAFQLYLTYSFNGR
ncbi:porin family protein [Hymenobacter sp. DG25A]|uniref:porin family protein n=1 Tax=Hymenobacter sp. DG25A TaxID=1385663 RepID=UPI0006C8AF02|nr:porin family protein [Hymenobacter sp. DG25A]